MAKKKIVVETCVKSINITAKAKAKKLTHAITFEKISLTSKQRDQVLELLETKDPIKLSFESMQDNLPGM